MDACYVGDIFSPMIMGNLVLASSTVIRRERLEQRRTLRRAPGHGRGLRVLPARLPGRSRRLPGRRRRPVSGRKCRQAERAAEPASHGHFVLEGPRGDPGSGRGPGDPVRPRWSPRRVVMLTGGWARSSSSLGNAEWLGPTSARFSAWDHGIRRRSCSSDSLSCRCRPCKRRSACAAGPARGSSERLDWAALPETLGSSSSGEPRLVSVGGEGLGRGPPRMDRGLRSRGRRRPARRRPRSGRCRLTRAGPNCGSSRAFRRRRLVAARRSSSEQHCAALRCSR